eukprot:1048496-Pyramimonas_sp.AAC.1
MHPWRHLSSTPPITRRLQAATRLHVRWGYANIELNAIGLVGRGGGFRGLVWAATVLAQSFLTCYKCYKELSRARRVPLDSQPEYQQQC